MAHLQSSAIKVFANNHKSDSIKKIIYNPATHPQKRYFAFKSIQSELWKYNPDSSKKYVRLLLSQSAVKDSVKALVYLVSGVSDYSKGNFDSALAGFRNALTFEKKVKRDEQLAFILTNFSNVFERLGNFDSSLFYATRALEISKGLKDQIFYAEGLYAVGNIYRKMKNGEKALEYFFQALKIAEDQNDLRGMAACCSNIGNCYNLLLNYERALRFFDRALNYNKTVGDSSGMAAVLNNMGHTYGKGKSPEKAVSYYKSSLEIRERIKDKNGIAYSLLSLGRIMVELKRYQEASIYFDQGIKIFRELGVHEGILYAYEGKLKLAALTDDFKTAYNIQLKYYNLKDSILGIQKINQINELEAKYQNAKKSNEIILLNSEKDFKDQEIKRQNFQKSAFAAGLVLALILVVVVFRNYRQKQLANSIIMSQKALVENQKFVLEIKNKEVHDSINYAKRLQEAILPPDSFRKMHLSQSFILYKPKDIVAGDFYWMEKKENIVFFAVADCTGHGVPGAIISVVCSNALNRSVNEFGLRKPGQILDRTRELVLETFSKSENIVRDGMDVSLCAINSNTGILEWAGANNPLWIVRKNREVIMNSESVNSDNLTLNDIIELVPDKQPVGQAEYYRPFNTQVFQLKQRDLIYLFSDGYADQFGGEKGKKFKSGNLKKFILTIARKPIEDQAESLMHQFEAWRGNLEQVDDVTIMGILV